MTHLSRTSLFESLGALIVLATFAVALVALADLCEFAQQLRLP